MSERTTPESATKRMRQAVAALAGALPALTALAGERAPKAAPASGVVPEIASQSEKDSAALRKAKESLALAQDSISRPTT